MSIEEAVNEVNSWGGRAGSFQKMRPEERSRHKARMRGPEDLKWTTQRTGYPRKDEIYDLLLAGETLIVPNERNPVFEYRLMKDHEKKDFGL